MARRSTYLASLAPVALFLAAMISADGKNSLLSTAAEAVVPLERAEPSPRIAAPHPAEHAPPTSAACRDSQSCYHAQLRRLQESALR